MPQPHRGERVLLGVRVPVELATSVRTAAHDQGFRSVNDYLLMLVAGRHNFPVSVTRADQASQEELPLKSAS